MHWVLSLTDAGENELMVDAPSKLLPHCSCHPGQLQRGGLRSAAFKLALSTPQDLRGSQLSSKAGAGALTSAFHSVPSSLQAPQTADPAS